MSPTPDDELEQLSRIRENALLQEKDDPDWVPIETPDFDCLDNTKELGPFYLSFSRPFKWDPPLWPGITREVAPPWRRGIGIQLRFFGLPHVSQEGIFFESKAVTLGIWWRGKAPSNLKNPPPEVSSVDKVATWRRGDVYSDSQQ